MTVIRFEKKNEYEGKPKGYSNTFYVYGAEDQLLCCCDVFGWGEKAPTKFRKSKESQEVAYTLAGKREFMNREFYLNEAEEGQRLGMITRKGSGTFWKLIDRQGKELGRFIDPAGFKEVFFRTLLQGSADRYALLVDGTLIGRIRQEKRPLKVKAGDG